MPSRHPPTNDPLAEALMQCVRNGRCLAILGAGVSHDDYPLWNGLVKTLQDRCSIRPEDLQGIDPHDTAKAALLIAEAAKAKDPQRFHEVLDEIFLLKRNARTAHRYHLLDRIPFCGYITLNFDPLLLNTLDLRRNVTVSEYPCLQPEHLSNHEPEEPELFYLHGRLGPDRPAEKAKIVLTHSEFEEAYDPFRGPIHAFLSSAFMDYDVCFVGCRPVETNLVKILGACERLCKDAHGLRDHHRPQRYLLWDSDSDPPDTLGACGIKIVRFEREDTRYSGLDEMLEYLAGKNVPKYRKRGVPRSVYASESEPER